MKKIILVLSLIFLISCQNEERVLNKQELEQEKVANNDEVKIYKAKSLDIAVKSLPFDVHLPEKIPNDFNSFKPVFISDWNDPNDGRDITFEIRATSKENDSLIVIYARDFDLKVINRYKQYGEKISLNNNQEVYFTPPNQTLPEWHSGSISWVNNNILYQVSYNGRNLKSDKVKGLLLDLVKQMQ